MLWTTMHRELQGVIRSCTDPINNAQWTDDCGKKLKLPGPHGSLI